MPTRNPLLLAIAASALACAGALAQGGHVSIAADTRNPAATDPLPITATDLLRLRQITSVSLTEDGTRAVFTVRSVHPDTPTLPSEGGSQSERSKHAYRTHLWTIDLTDPAAGPVQLTHGDRGDSDPAISPDGRWLAFVRKGEAKPGADLGAKGGPTSQVWRMPLAGPGEAHAVTSLEHGAAAPRWHPDGRALLVSSPIPFSKIEGKPEYPFERPGRDWRDWDFPPVTPAAGEDGGKPPKGRPDGDRRAIRNWLETNAADANPLVINRLAFQDELSLRGEPAFDHLFLIEFDDAGAAGEAKQLTRGFRDHNDARWSPDGGVILFVSDGSSPEHADRIRRTAIYGMSADGSGVRPFLEDTSLSIDSPRFHPSGRAVAFRATETDERIFRQSKLGAINPTTGAFSMITGSWDSHAGAGVVTAGDLVLFTSPWHGANRLYATQLRRRAEPVPMTGPEASVGDFDEAMGVVVAAVSTIDNPSELYLIRAGEAGGVSEGAAPMRRLTDLNTNWVSERAISRATEHWITRDDGTRVQYWVMPPTGAEPGEKYPVVLEMHGGPMAMWGPSEQSMWHEFQLLCSWGYGVVYCNPRGSSGYGYEFQKGNFQNWGAGPAADVLAAFDDAVKNNEWIDTDRAFITGGSYAGYLTAWIIAHDHRFKAAVAQRGVYDLDTFFGEGNAWILVEEAFGGFPWEPATAAILKRESPFTYVHQITTPFLIIHSSSDLRTGVSQSEMMYRALKELNRPVEYVRYPGAGHDLSRTGDPKQRMDRLLRIVEFFERFSNNERPAPTGNAPR